LNEKLEAIFIPLISRATAGYAVIFAAIVIGLSIFLLPSQEIFYLPLYVTPDALAMGKTSDFPFALSATYSFSVYLSLACCFMTGFAKGNLRGLAKIREGQSVFFRVVSDLLIVLYIGLLLTHEFLPLNTLQFSYAFFTNVLRDRSFAFIWVEGIFLLTYISALVCMFDISMLVRKNLCK
jgi:hypothetical protein